MLETLNKLNPEIKVYSVRDDEFKKYGRIIDIDTKECVDTCLSLDFPTEGSAYEPSVKALEDMKCADEIREMTLGGCKAQIGICHGYNTVLNALEYHNCSEINVAATPLVLLLATRWDMDENGDLDASKIKAFLLEKGDAVEVFATTLHFCPCQATNDGFSCLVALPEGTNTLLDAPAKDKLLFKRNKWLICHEDNEGLKEKGIYPGIHGTNYEIKPLTSARKSQA